MRHKLPQRHLFGATDCKLIVLRLSQFHVLDHATPGDASRCLSENGWDERHLSNDVTVGHVPDEHLAVEGVSRRQKQLIVVGERKILNLVVMLRQPVNGLLLSKVPDNNVGVLSALTRCKQLAIVGDLEASDGVVMGGQEVLVVRVLNVSDHDAAADDKKVFASARVQMNRVDDGAGEADRVIKLDLAARGNFSLADSTGSDIGFVGGLKFLRLRCNWRSIHHGLFSICPIFKLQ